MRASGEAGFTILEALVAVAILGFATGAIVYSNRLAAERAATALDRFRAVLAAESTLKRLGLDLAIEPGRRLGASPDGVRWALDIRRRDGGEGTRGLYDATIEATARDGHVVRLATSVVRDD